jgi:hypothetical protein
MAVGSSVRIRISHLSSVFTALGRVVHAGVKADMGVIRGPVESVRSLKVCLDITATIRYHF